MVKAAMIAYRDFPTVVNEIPESGLTYRNELHEYAKMDSMMQQAQQAIGGSSDSAQLAQSYMWSKVANGEFDDEYQDLYHNVVILAVLAQVAIDGIKRQYAVDPNDEIARIRIMDCMKREKDYPLFMKYTHKIQMTKNGEERPYEEIKKEKSRVSQRIDKNLVCPMNYLEEYLDKIQGATQRASIDIGDLFLKIEEKPNNRQMVKIRKIVEDYSNYVKINAPLIDENTVDNIFEQKFNDTIIKISSMRIRNNAVFNRLIETSLKIVGNSHDHKQYKDATKYTMQMLNILYKLDKYKFLSNFKNAESK